MFLSDGSLTGSTFSRFSKCAILPLAIRMPNARSPGIVFVYFFLATLAAASVLSRLVAWLFWTPAKNVLRKLLDDEAAAAWTCYVFFTPVVAGVAAGARVSNP